MPTKAKAAEVAADPNLKLAGKEWNECAGQPMVEIKLSLLEPDEDNVKPDQVFHYTFNGEPYSFRRGRKEFIPRDHFILIYQGMPSIL
jgi:hypothetical protein